MLKYLNLIFSCQLAGELAVRALHLPVPGPVIGMVLLLCWLFYCGGVAANLETVADGLLRHLSLLFVPAGVGVMLHFRLLGEEWMPLGVAVVLSTVLTIAVTGFLMSRLGKMRLAIADREEGDG